MSQSAEQTFNSQKVKTTFTQVIKKHFVMYLYFTQHTSCLPRFKILDLEIGDKLSCFKGCLLNYF